MKRALVLALCLAPTMILAAETDRRQGVATGERLELRNYDGSVTISRGGGAELHVWAEHAEDDSIVIERVGSTWLVVPALWRDDSGAFAVQLPNVGRVRVTDDDAPPQQVAFRVEVPEWMPVLVESPLGSIEIDGVMAPIEATAMLGNITVHGGLERVYLRTMNGRITLTGAEGRLTAETTQKKVVVQNSRGDIRIETTGGDVEMTDLDAESLSVQTMGGDVTYAGSILSSARWELTSQNGDIAVRLDGDIDARFDLRAFEGEVDFGYPTDVAGSPDEVRVAIGRGLARVSAKTFRGRIAVGPR